MNEEFEALSQEAQVLNDSVTWWGEESTRVMSEVWQLRDGEDDLKKLQELEARLAYLEHKGYFEAERMRELDDKLVKYFIKRMEQCRNKRKTNED